MPGSCDLAQVMWQLGVRAEMSLGKISLLPCLLIMHLFSPK